MGGKGRERERERERREWETVLSNCGFCFREDGPHRLLFIDKMIDDRTEYGTSYYEFLTHISRQLSK